MEKLKELPKALIAAQQEIKSARKSGSNPHFKSSYSDLSDVWDACRDALNKNGLCIAQTTAVREGPLVVLQTRLIHVSGEELVSEYPLNPVKPDPQAMGSALTYARRYTLAAMVGVVQEDDDGNAASAERPEKQAPTIEHLKKGMALEKDLAKLLERWKDRKGDIDAAVYRQGIEILDDAIRAKAARIAKAAASSQ